jgi:hypothetical protein
MAEIVNIQNINPQTFELQEYSQQDTSLISTTTTFDTWDSTVDHIEYFIYDLNGNILYENVAGYPQYTLIDNNLVIDPENDLKSQGYLEGNYNTLYNFLKYRLASNTVNQYYISQISADRTEIRLDTTTISNADVIFSTNEFINYRTSSSVFIDFYLDFGNNNLVIANNILLDISNPNNPTILIKLYESLPQQFDINSQCWVVESISISSAYNINITQTFDIIQNGITLQGPNLNIAVKDQINNSTPFANYNSLKSNTSALGTGSLQYQINSILAERGIEINIDYSDYSDFIYFSSAQTRLENFYYKLELLEEYQYSASISNTSPTSIYISASNAVWLAKINDIITNFDGYEYYLYYESGSTAWPKTNTNPPYINAGANSVAGLAFLASQSIVAENYDIQNNNRLINAIPSYISEDPNNSQYLLFTDMLGQSFDSVWVYIKDVTNKSNADNRIDYGVSRDLVANVLRDLGVKIYQNNFSTDDLYSALIGLTPSGSLYNLPYTTGSLPVPAGTFLDYITNYVTASSTSSLIPTYDINSETYKRIYHNLPYLYKKKGTVEGLRALITLYGIPDTILRINEFGGKDKNPNTYDYWQDEYNYALAKLDPGNDGVDTLWQLEPQWNSYNNRPQTLEFRFKSTNLQYAINSPSQSLWTLDNGINKPSLVLDYTGSGYTSGSYSGSIPNPYNEWATLTLYPESNNFTATASLYLPFFNEEWWSIAVTLNKDTNKFTLYAGNSPYNGADGNIIGYFSSSSVTINSTGWIAGGSYILPYDDYVRINGKRYAGFSGSLQEIRYYSTNLNAESIQNFVMNSDSIEGNGIDNTPDQLAFRAALGGELYTIKPFVGLMYSIHPKVTGSWIPTASFVGGVNFFDTYTNPFLPNYETHFYDQVPSGIQDAVSQKIQTRNIVLPYTSSNTNIKNIPNNNVLSPFRTLQQNIPISSSYTANVDYLEVAFSPQNEINEDINDQIGYFNIGELIGDPREVPSRNTHYPVLDDLRDYYFEKYTSNYQFTDYIRLIKFFDNSLFKMIQDFIPAHTDLAAGIVIKQHLLERNRYPQPQVTPISTQYTYGSGSNPSIYWSTPEAVEDITITASIKGIPGLLDGQKIYTSSTQYESFPIETAIGGQGGTMPEFPGTASTDYFVNVTQSYNITTPSLLGYVTTLHDDKSEFFNGELSGSTIITDKLGNLTDPDCLPYLHASTVETPYKTIFFKSTDLGGSQTSITYFTNPQLAPNPGEIYLYWDSGSVYTSTPLVPQQSPGAEF